jgi:hypothetical protein
MKKESQNLIDKSLRGYYYNLSLSPYVLHTSHGEYPFPSAKKFDVFVKEYEKKLKRLYDSANFITTNTPFKLDIRQIEFDMMDELYQEHKKKF